MLPGAGRMNLAAVPSAELFGEEEGRATVMKAMVVPAECIQQSVLLVARRLKYPSSPEMIAPSIAANVLPR